ncbi:Mechanosensitive ion channel-domain-containing protein [Epithele typhae]|uniref:Mechanosensitive ion channel-domain-containing protein n=1 Tax=Epithele typhae TaxID=378194 RepID=UPI0020080B97|nr:Mechanosensitive ion channel-domain-containing protein [Epithele typhae]KAH9927138.1 Mechanosensitive ion channel-domain-containing protein [Epithele typhae]
MASDDHEEKHAAHHEKHDPHAPKPKQPTAVHYTDDIHPPRPGTFQRADTYAPSVAGSDDDNNGSDQDYDWSGEEDLVDEEAKFEQAMGTKKKQRSCCAKFFTLLFSTLIGSTILSGLIITPALLVHFLWYKKDPTDHRRYVKDNIEAWLFWAAANVSISWALALIVDIIPVIIRSVISLAWGHVSEHVKSRLELYNSVKGPIKPVLYAASGWVSWIIIFSHIFNLFDMDDGSQSRASYTPRVYQAIEFLFFFTLVVCLQKILSHFIAFSFHRTAFKERLDEVTTALRVIEKLRNYRPKRRHAHKSSYGRMTPTFSNLLTPAHDKGEFFSRSRPATPSGSRAGSRSGSPDVGAMSDVEDRDATLVGKKGKNRLSWFSHDKGHSEPLPEHQEYPLPEGAASEHRYPPSPHTASPLRGHHRSESDEDAAAVVQQAATTAAKALKSAMLHDARGIKGDGDEDTEGLMWNVSTSSEAKRLARSIYTALKVPGRTYLIPRDFVPAFGKLADAEAAFKVFDKDGNGDLSRAEIKTTVLKVYKERRFLSRSMRDVSQALLTLNSVLLLFALIILFFISLSIFGVNIESSLTSLYTIGLGLSFIFKASAANAFDAIMFLFVTHPYDTGDRCFIDDENLVVKKMTLFATIFTRADGTETYYFNSQLFNKFIINARRSDKTAENLTMQISWRTPMEKLDQLERCLNQWLQTEENRWFQPSTNIMLQKIEYQRYLECTIGIPYNSNWQDWGMHNTRKTAFHAAVNYYCRQLGITLYNTPIPIAFADPETGEFVAPDVVDTVGADEEVERPPSPPPAPHQGATAPAKRVWMGFQPPREDGIPNGMRPRKARSRKAMLRTFGADGF